jgi:hypothetical protein
MKDMQKAFKKIVQIISKDLENRIYVSRKIFDSKIPAVGSRYGPRGTQDKDYVKKCNFNKNESCRF